MLLLEERDLCCSSTHSFNHSFMHLTIHLSIPSFIHSFIHSSSTHLQSIGQVKFWLMMSENRCSVPYPVQNSKRHCGLKRKCPIGWESANQSSNTNIFSFYLSHCKQSLHTHFCGSCVKENWFSLPHESLLGASNYIKHLKV